MQFESQGIQVSRVTVWSWSEAKPMQEIFTVVLLAVIGFDYTPELFLILVEEPDAILPAGES